MATIRLIRGRVQRDGFLVMSGGLFDIPPLHVAIPEGVVDVGFAGDTPRASFQGRLVSYSAFTSSNQSGRP
jgi:hypothetical protein